MADIWPNRNTPSESVLLPKPLADMDNHVAAVLPGFQAQHFDLQERCNRLWETFNTDPNSYQQLKNLLPQVKVIVEKINFDISGSYVHSSPQKTLSDLYAIAISQGVPAGVANEAYERNKQKFNLVLENLRKLWVWLENLQPLPPGSTSNPNPDLSSRLASPEQAVAAQYRSISQLVIDLSADYGAYVDDYADFMDRFGSTRDQLPAELISEVMDEIEEINDQIDYINTELLGVNGYLNNTGIWLAKQPNADQQRITEFLQAQETVLNNIVVGYRRMASGLTQILSRNWDTNVPVAPIASNPQRTMTAADTQEIQRVNLAKKDIRSRINDGLDAFTVKVMGTFGQRIIMGIPENAFGIKAGGKRGPRERSRLFLQINHRLKTIDRSMTPRRLYQDVARAGVGRADAEAEARLFAFCHLFKAVYEYFKRVDPKVLSDLRIPELEFGQQLASLERGLDALLVDPESDPKKKMKGREKASKIQLNLQRQEWMAFGMASAGKSQAETYRDITAMFPVLLYGADILDLLLAMQNKLVVRSNVQPVPARSAAQVIAVPSPAQLRPPPDAQPPAFDPNQLQFFRVQSPGQSGQKLDAAVAPPPPVAAPELALVAHNTAEAKPENIELVRKRLQQSVIALFESMSGAGRDWSREANPEPRVLRSAIAQLSTIFNPDADEELLRRLDLSPPASREPMIRAVLIDWAKGNNNAVSSIRELSRFKRT